MLVIFSCDFQHYGSRVQFCRISNSIHIIAEEVVIFISYSSVSEITCSETNINLFLMFHGPVTRRGSLSNQSSNTTVSTGVPTLQVNLNALRRHPVLTVLELQKAAQNGSTMIPIFLWGLCVQVMKLPLAPYAFCATTCYQNSSVLPAKHRRHRDTNHSEYKDKIFSSVSLRH
jgi:hypothetical protein